MIDPYTSTKKLKGSISKDERRMNSIDNGLMLCLQHHKQFDTHMFSIHPEVGIKQYFRMYLNRSISDARRILVPPPN